MAKRVSAVSTRQARSISDTRVEVGIATAPTFNSPRRISHSSMVLLSITIIESPRRTPRDVSQLATWSERLASSAYDQLVASRLESTIVTAARSGCSPATTSNHSRAKLNSSNCGQRNSRTTLS